MLKKGNLIPDLFYLCMWAKNDLHHIENNKYKYKMKYENIFPIIFLSFFGDNLLFTKMPLELV